MESGKKDDRIDLEENITGSRFLNPSEIICTKTFF